LSESDESGRRDVYVRYSREPVARTFAMAAPRGETINVDFDAAGGVIGVELLDVASVEVGGCEVAADSEQTGEELAERRALQLSRGVGRALDAIARAEREVRALRDTGVSEALVRSVEIALRSAWEALADGAEVKSGTTCYACGHASVREHNAVS
jgi:hypothetical protein